MARKRIRQLTLEFDPPGWGGSRVGSGRKKKGNLPHRSRAPFTRETAAHVNAHLVSGRPSLRNDAEYLVLLKVFEKSREGEGFRVVHYSVQHSHLHMIVEAQDRKHMTQGMRGLLVRAARALNRLWGIRGRVFADRFHEHLLRVPREARNALAYVLGNARRHGVPISRGCPDPLSSGRFFDGWRDFAAVRIPGLFLPISAARTWLLTEGWRKHGPIPVDLAPGT